MTGNASPDNRPVRLHPPPALDFDPFDATRQDLIRHGLPVRPDPRTQPGMAALWDRKAHRYRGFEHLEPRLDAASAAPDTVVAVPALGLDASQSCGYQLTSYGPPFTVLVVTWTVPDLRFSPNPFGVANGFHTFAGLGFLDVHVEMSVDSAQSVTSRLWAQDVGDVNLPVRPGDVISATLCLNPEPPGTAFYFLANETTAQTIHVSVDTEFPPAVSINAGVTRTEDPNAPPAASPLARFGAVYFDEITAYTTSGTRSLTAGEAVTMVDEHGATLAIPVRLTDDAFKAMFVAA